MCALIRQLGWFLAVGCSAAATHWVVAVSGVKWLQLDPLVANLAGWLLAFGVSFSGHFRFTFRQHGQPWRTAARRFFLISAAGFLINEAAYAWLLHTTAVRYDILLAFILISMAVLTFIFSRLWAFRRSAAP